MFDNLKNKIKVFNKISLENLFHSLFNNQEFQEYIIDLNTIDQLYSKGQDSTGESIGQYSDATIYGTSNFKGKIEKGQPIDRVTLKDTGEFYGSFKTLWEGTDIKITANTMKGADDLLQQWGKDIVGLSDESLIKLREFSKPLLRSLILTQLKKVS